MNCNYDNYTINIITHDPGNTPEIISKLYPLEIKIFNGNNFPSFSKIVNETIVSSENDNVIIINYKARPNKKDIFKILDLLDKGYGFVGLYRFGFFGVNKNLIKKIGFFDERYIGGEYEDCDFIRRLLYHNIAFYISEEIEYIYRPSLWNNSISKKFFEKNGHIMIRRKKYIKI
jgi:GT2 family glycosyltransferase